MARFIPEVSPEDIVHDSERVVYEALRGLPTGFVVLHSFPWLRPTRDLSGEPLREGEADFVILHPERGLLVLEVKGGRPEWVGRVWRRGGKELHDPFDQARRSRYALLDAIEELLCRLPGLARRARFTVQHERHRQLLRQCLRRELLSYAQSRSYSRRAPPHAAAHETNCLPIQRGRLQSNSPTQCQRLS